jgi:hypothetical protein
MTQYTPQDLPLFRRAFAARWDIPQETKKKVVDFARETLESQDTSSQDKTRAAKLLIEVDKLNLRQEQMLLPKINVNIDYHKLSDADIERKLKELNDLERTVLDEPERLDLPGNTDPEAEATGGIKQTQEYSDIEIQPDISPRSRSALLPPLHKVDSNT